MALTTCLSISMRHTKMARSQKLPIKPFDPAVLAATKKMEVTLDAINQSAPYRSNHVLKC